MKARTKTLNKEKWEIVAVMIDGVVYPAKGKLCK